MEGVEARGSSLRPPATASLGPQDCGKEGARFDTFLCFSAKTWQHTSRAPAELGFLSVSKEEFQPLVTWQEGGIK